MDRTPISFAGRLWYYGGAEDGVAGLPKTLSATLAIATVSAGAAAAYIWLAGPPLRMPQDVGSVPVWLVTAPNSWVLLIALVFAIAVTLAWRHVRWKQTRRREVLAYWQRTRQRSEVEASVPDPPPDFDPDTLVVLRGFSLGDDEPLEFAATREAAPPEEHVATVPEMWPEELHEAARLGLCGFPLPEEIARIRPGAPASILPHFDAAIARRLLQRRLELAIRIAAMSPANALSRRDVADTHSRLGDAALTLGEFDAAEADFKAAIAVFESDPFGQDREIQAKLIFFNFLKLTSLAAVRARRGEALEYLDQAEADLAALPESDPAWRELVRGIAAIRNNLTGPRRGQPASPGIRDRDPPDWAEPKPNDGETFSGLFDILGI